jgi:hypothetical protein
MEGKKRKKNGVVLWLAMAVWMCAVVAMAGDMVHGGWWWQQMWIGRRRRGW